MQLYWQEWVLQEVNLVKVLWYTLEYEIFSIGVNVDSLPRNTKFCQCIGVIVVRFFMLNNSPDPGFNDMLWFWLAVVVCDCSGRYAAAPFFGFGHFYTIIEWLSEIYCPNADAKCTDRFIRSSEVIKPLFNGETECMDAIINSVGWTNCESLSCNNGIAHTNS